jgi:hypothetical protein
LGKTNAFQNKTLSFQQLMDETIAEAWEHLQDCISACPHHGVKEWFIIQSYYHGLTRLAREHVDAAAGGSSLSIEEARTLNEQMAYSQSWNDKCTQTHTRMVHQLEEVVMLTDKIDLLMNKLKDSGIFHHVKMVDSCMT